MNNTEYREGLRQLVSAASSAALAICRAWHGEHFGEPGWGGIDVIRYELRKAEEAVAVLGERDDLAEAIDKAQTEQSEEDRQC